METVRAYSHRLLTAFRALTNRQGELNSPLTDQVFLRDYFVDNLASSQIRRQVRDKVFADPQITFLRLRDDAIRWAEDEGQEASTLLVASTAATPTPSTSMDALEERLMTKMASMIEKLMAQSCPVQTQTHPSPPRPARRQIICFRCNEAGHIARRCPKNALSQ